MRKYIWLALGLVIIGCAGEQQKRTDRLNVLFIVLDDLRPELECYGVDHIKSPHIDQLATEGALFTRAYCQQAVCAPSRNSFMTGLRPDDLRNYHLNTNFRRTAPDVVTMSQHFVNNGYRTESIGKIYHTGHGNYSDSASWSTIALHIKDLLIDEKLTRGDTVGINRDVPRVDRKKIAYFVTPFEETIGDKLVVDHAIKRLKALKDSSFFLAVGLTKPHLPFIAPKKYFELYPLEEIEVPDKENIHGYPALPAKGFGELRKYHQMPPEGPVSENIALRLIQGYRACVTMMDDQVGRLVQQLKQLDLYDNTIIVFTSDHGYKLGEYGSWVKHTNFELDTRVPLIIRVPGIEPTRTSALSELVDIYPTLSEAAGLPIPRHTRGKSLLPVMKGESKQIKKVALSQYPRNIKKQNSKGLMGYSMRTERFRYTKWYRFPERDSVVYTELYDHDVDQQERNNVANDLQYEAQLLDLDQIFKRSYNFEKLNWGEFY